MDKAKLLIAEDVPAQQRLYEQIINPDLFELRMAGDGEEAMAVYREWQPDILVLDISMPLMTGYSMLKLIRTELKDRTTAVIMASGHREEEDIISCGKLGIQRYLIKPLPLGELEEILIYSLAETNPEKAEPLARARKEAYETKMAELKAEADRKAEDAADEAAENIIRRDRSSRAD